MRETVIHQLGKFGQSIWFDSISRDMIISGKLKEMITQGLRGLTSNPTIFEKAISLSSNYDETIAKLTSQNKSTFDIYDDLTVKDVQDAADLFLSTYKNTNKLDGYVSLEINPELAHDLKKTIEEGLRLHKKVNRPNLMLKVPSTDEGFQAIEEFIALGINTNATLVFSLAQYKNTAQAYLKGIKRFLDKGGDISCVHSVASVFISRIDTVVDKLLAEKLKAESNQEVATKIKSLQGRAAVANSSIIYKEYLDIISSAEFKKLQDKGLNLQRVLWASTSTKNPTYNDIKYVTELIGKNTINTVPPATFDAILDHGIVEENLSSEVTFAQEVIKDLRGLGIDIDKVCTKLLKDGVEAFAKSFFSLLETIEIKKNTYAKSVKES